jgi:hypothetical protein
MRIPGGIFFPEDVMRPGHDHVEELKLGDAVSALLNECRMILPGVQTLFGFQLIAVYQPPFFEMLTPREQHLHLFALGLIALSAALIMAPAAYHRQTAPRQASEGFIRLASWFLLIALVPLVLGISIDFYLVARLVRVDRALSILLAILLGLMFVVAWYVLPHWSVLHRFTGMEDK